MQNNDREHDLNHDINSTISSLVTALELIKDEWKKSPELVDRIIPLTIDKMELLSAQVKEFRKKH